MKSLKARLGSGLVIVLLVVFTIQFLLVSLAVRHVTDNYVLTFMARDIDNLLADITFDKSGQPRFISVPDSTYTRQLYSGYYYLVESNNHTLRSRSLWDHDLVVQAPVIGESMAQKMAGPLQQDLLVLSKTFSKQGHDIAITVAEDLSLVNESIATFEKLYLGVSIVMLLVLLVSQYVLINHSLKSLTSTRINLERLAKGEAEKLPDDVPSEIKPLVDEINSLLSLLGRHLVKVRTLVGNLAHALKTPLSQLSRLSDEPEIARHDRLRQELNRQVTEIHAALERELNRARLAGDGKSGQRFRPATELPPLIHTVKKIHNLKDIMFTLHCPDDVVLPADREDMLELFGNLLDNAAKWCDKSINVQINNNGIVIEDDGPGCPLKDMDALIQRGLRLDEKHQGHGLGLAIVGDIVDHYRGKMHFDNSPDTGGLRVSIRLYADESPAGND